MRMSLFGIIVGSIALIYGGLWWYGRTTHNIAYGVSFHHLHASTLGYDWREMYVAMLDDLRPPFVRISAQWNDIEISRGQYDFSSLDFMMSEAASRDVRVTMAVGQKGPRWPECHIPAWAVDLDGDEYRSSLYAYVGTVVDRYRTHPALEYWQVENEPYINFTFGECARFDETAIDREIELVRERDADHQIIITDSGELSTWIPASRKGDIFGTTLYRTVRTPRGMVVSYDWLPAGFYRAKARILGIDTTHFFVSELQAEPWYGEGSATATPLDEQFKTMNPERMRANMEYVRHVDARRAYLWGVEWWYFMKYTHDDTSFIDLAREYIDTYR